MLFTVYGIAIAISSWLSGVIAETIGVRKTMWLGFGDDHDRPGNC